MPIKIGPNYINFTSANGITYTLQETVSGFDFNGKILAKFRANTNFSYGYVAGGQIGPSSYTNVIEKFSFSIDRNSTDVGDISAEKSYLAGHFSTVSGYTSGGQTTPLPTPATINVIDKYSFVIDKNSTDVGDLTVNRYGCAGHSSSTNGFTTGGANTTPVITNVIDKFPFASDANATDVGDLSTVRYLVAGNSSSTEGYILGGLSSGSVYSNVIEKFPFAVNANATDVGDLSVAKSSVAGISSTVDGYSTGGFQPAVGAINVIEKFPFASGGNASDVGDLTSTLYHSGGLNSSSDGYIAVGTGPVFHFSSKFPFASGGNSTLAGISLYTLAGTNPLQAFSVSTSQYSSSPSFIAT